MPAGLPAPVSPTFSTGGGLLILLQYCARVHLFGARFEVLLYDLTSTYFEIGPRRSLRTRRRTRCNTH
jgi:hypothetical protein